MPAIGIDLGTTNCCVAVWKEHADTDEDDRVEIIVNDLGKRVTPSYVAFTSTERIVGAPAKDQARHNLKNTVHSVKRLIGRKFSDTVVQDDITGWPFHVVRGPQGDPTIRVKQGSTAMQLAPQQISAVLLEKMKAIAEEFMDEEITQAVITVPAYFTDHQRCATIEAAEKAGLEVLRIINEPMAAALTYGLDSTLHSESTVLIFDLGGGTCDVCILRIGDGSFEVIAVKGDTHLGGEDIDKRLVEHMLQVISERHGLDLSGNPKSRSRLHAVAEQAKHTLSANSVAHIDVDSLLEGGDFQTKITRATLEHTCADLLDRAKALVTSCLEDAGLEAEDIDEVVLVGGSTRIPKVQSLLRQVFPGKALNKRINPDEAVAYGAAVQAAMLAERRPRQLRQLAVQDVTPLSLGIGLHNDTVAVVIPKNSPTPASVTRHNFVIPTGCAGVAIPVYEGEERVAHKSSFLGEFALVGLPKSSTGSNQVEVTFEIDVNGILAVKAMHRGSGKWRQVTVTHGNHGVSGDA